MSQGHATLVVMRSQLQAQVLVIDDEAELRELLVETLCGSGFTADGVENAESALRWIAQHGAPRCIILDIRLGGMSGLEFLDRKQDIDGLRDVPVFVCTASHRFETSPPAGVERVFLKPIDVDAMTAAVAVTVG